MAIWAQIEELEPALAARARAYLEAHKHLTIAKKMTLSLTAGRWLFGSAPVTVA